MEKLEAFIFLITDQFTDNLLVTPHNSYVMYSMLFFGYDKLLIYCGALIGNMLAFMSNYYIGIMLALVIDIRNSVNFRRIETIFKQKGKFFLLLPLHPFYNIIISTLSGITKLNFFTYLKLSFIGNVIYLAFYIFLS